MDQQKAADVAGTLGAPPTPLQGALQNLAQSGTTLQPPVNTGSATVVNTSNSLLLSRIEALIGKLDTAAKSEEATIKTYLAKYWPIAAGLAAAATRFL